MVKPPSSPSLVISLLRDSLSQTSTPYANLYLPQQDDPSIQAFILAALTAGGGITGYARTGSIPSVAAGVTVGALVRLPSEPRVLLPLL